MPLLKRNDKRIQYGGGLGREVLQKQHFPLLFDDPSRIRKRVVLAKISKVIH